MPVSVRAADGLRFGVLGPLEVRRDGSVVDLGAAKQRTLLACLLMRANQVVTIPELVDALWPAAAPADARGTVQKYVMRLRRALEAGDVIHTEADGYRIELRPGQLDLDRYRELAADARRAADRADDRADDRSAEPGDAGEEAALLREALSLWRGVSPLSDVDSPALHGGEILTLVEQHLQLLERRIELDLRAGHYYAVAAELRTLVAEHPYRERFWAQLVRAFAGGGRRAEALAAYREITGMLADELGVDPGREVRAAHQELLAGHSTNGTAPATRASHPSAVVPRQLPMPARGFVGRRTEIDTVVGALRPAVLDPEALDPEALDPEALDPEAGRSSMPVVVVAGPAGAGKTTLAVHAAHQVSDRFPDGQLFADLRGHAADDPVTVEQVLGRFLRSLGSAPEGIPLHLDDQIAAYRSSLAGRRMLVVLDNAGSEEQVRALLPASPGCAVIVTSRYELAGLDAEPDADRVPLTMLSPAEARTLLRAVLDGPRLAEDDAAVGSLIDCCGHLPLALRLAAAHLLLHPELRLADYVEQLRSHGAVSTLRVPGDDRANLAAAFDWSYRQLPPAQRRVLRLLSLVPGPDFGVDAAGALTGYPAPEAARTLEQLAAAHLVERRAEDRFGLHDLVREYAATRCRAEEDAADQERARERLFGFYLAGADAVAEASPVTQGLSRLPRPWGLTRAGDPDPAWVERELAVIAAVARYSAEHGPHHFAYHLADALRAYFLLRAPTADWLAVTEAGLRAARLAGAEYATAAMLHDRGNLSQFVGDLGGSMIYLQEALEIYRRFDTREADAVRISAGNAARSLGRLDTAIPNLDTALRNYLRAGDTRWTTIARQYLLLALLVAGDLGRARQERDRLAHAARLGNHVALLATGRCTQLTGDLREAASILRSAVDRARDNGDRRMGLAALIGLARCQLELGGDREAHDYASTALGSDPDPHFAAEAETVLARALTRMGRGDEARGRFQVAWRAARSSENPEQVCEALTGLAELECAAGRPGRAVDHATEALSVAETCGMRICQVHALVALAESRGRAGDPDRARHAAEQALALSTDRGYPLGRALAFSALADVTRTGDRAGDAAGYRAHADRIYRAIGSFRRAPVE